MRYTRLLDMSALVLIFVLVGSVYSEVIEVPGDYSSITVALEATNANDTVLVHPGTYQDRLIFPSHDVVLISDFFMTGDSSAIDSTIIDATVFADLDTSSVLTFVNANTRATFVGGFTLTGGHGCTYSPGNKRGGGLYFFNSSPTIHSCQITGNQVPANGGGFVLLADSSSPRISHCRIHDNCGPVIAMNFAHAPASGEPVVFEWNEVYENYACNYPGPYPDSNNLSTWASSIIVRFNSFHDYEGSNCLGLYLYDNPAEVCGNTFERITGYGIDDVILTTDYAVLIRDNLFRDLQMDWGACIALAYQASDFNPYRNLVERNWFENIHKTDGEGPTALWMQHPNAEVRENVFLNCVAYVGAVQLSQSPSQGCDVLFERNSFFYNQATYAGHNGSAFKTLGAGHPCAFADNWFEGNEGWAIYLDITIQPEADMSNNYWGDPSGPFHPTENPGGLGDSVPANVHVTPWLTAPPGINEAIEERLTLKPEEWTLETAFPNPFNSVVNLRLSASKPQPFEVSAYNTLGQRVAQVWQGVVPKDSPTLVRWNGTGDRGGSVASGIYYLVVSPRGPGAHAGKSMKVVLLR